MERIPYKSHFALFQDDDSGDEILSYDHLPQSKDINKMNIEGDEQPGNHLQRTKIIFDNICLVFFDLETSGFQADCDILQVAMKCGDFTFAKYLSPGSAKIHPKATEANGLRKEGTDLYWNEKKVPTEQSQVVVHKMYSFLKSLDHPCVLIAHNCSFDAPRLTRLIMKESRVHEISTVIIGFVDTLPLFKNKFPERKGPGACSLTTLPSETMSLATEGAHNAFYDLYM
ncbi:hypothetical protein HCN44_010960 [Aphidius gifuensis]|uniref:Exonuclease domain-containing protein n=1 Tax=Aphidius gifuensis TaxID=684658 RepID=A0A835CWI6_APHGI|nr:hypothetical protein HCN44_010960 [Aphidius gifuensis]